MEIRLNKESINTAIEKLNNLREEITNISLTRIVDRLVNEGASEANDYTMGAPQSGLEASRVVSKTLKSGLAGYVALVGPNAVYDEFGTGEEGAADPHPLKGNFGLNPYNSGYFVSRQVDDKGLHYWIYKPMSGNSYFDIDDIKGKTYGIPSGKMIYHASTHVRNIKDQIVKDELNATVKKFK